MCVDFSSVTSKYQYTELIWSSFKMFEEYNGVNNTTVKKAMNLIIMWIYYKTAT